ncbi:ARHGG factor, partial [Amia calva]|nr:ARHGG factor [Amia calva]
MSHRQSDGSLGDQAPLLLEKKFASELRLEGISGPQVTVSVAEPSSEEEPAKMKPIVLSTQSQAAMKLGTQQIIPKNLAVSSRSKVRHHTTVVTLPVSLEPQVDKRASAPPDGSWDDYDSDGEGCTLGRNRRNQSYRVAVKSLDNLSPTSLTSSQLSTLKPKSFGRKRNAKHGGSFKDEPRLYQEIRERGLHANNQDTDDELLDDFVQVEHPEPDRGIVVKNYRPAHLSWSQLPQVQEQGILQMITAEERKRQEAIFEIITSEYSYQHSLSILVRLFKGSHELRKTMTATEHHHLFSNISEIQAISQLFFEDLEMRHRDNPLIRNISDIVQNYAANYFNPYIVYCSNEMYQQRTLQKLLSTNTAFKEVLKKIEISEECGGLPMISFLILPMQRVTRLPLLMDTICQKTPPETVEYSAAVWALKDISKLVKKCNDGAKRMERTEQMYTIQNQMEFGKIKPFPLISASRWLLKRGELAVCTEEPSIFRKAFSNKSYYLFLFNDVLIITRKKSEESYVVMEYARLPHVDVEVLEKNEGQMSPPTKPMGGSSPYLLKVLLKRTSDGRQDQFILASESQIDRARWVTALSQHKQMKNNINKEDLSQYEVTKAYMPKEPDELGLQQADVVIVMQKEDGWYFGERLRDGQSGWFPAGCASEITNRVAVEQNVRRMERLRKETNV